MNNTDSLGYLVPDRKLMHNKRPRVIIVGAGLGGLTLAMLLEKTDIPYEVIERAPVFKPLGKEKHHNWIRSVTSCQRPMLVSFTNTYQDLLLHDRRGNCIESLDSTAVQAVSNL